MESTGERRGGDRNGEKMDSGHLGGHRRRWGIEEEWPACLSPSSTSHWCL